MLTDVNIGALYTEVHWADGARTPLPNLWLRDNCSCGDCRIEQTSEKKFLISSVPVDLSPVSASVKNNELLVNWPDGHTTRFEGDQIQSLLEPDRNEVELWDSNFRPDTVDYREFLASDEAAAEGIRRFLLTGALVITDMPSSSGMVEELQPRLGRIRDMPFGRLHEVLVDPSGYNVAHTALPLPPHNDFASANWPPSIQALHMLINECEGGESVIVDGWAVAESMRIEFPDLFDALCTVPVPFRMFSDDEETSAANPLIRLDSSGAIAHVRYSNQLMQPIGPAVDGVGTFYKAYHEFTSRLTSAGARAVFRLESGQCLLVAGHRVLHAREAFKPTGKRHLQDAYFEHDCCRNHLTVIERRLRVEI